TAGPPGVRPNNQGPVFTANTGRSQLPSPGLRGLRNRRAMLGSALRVSEARDGLSANPGLVHENLGADPSARLLPPWARILGWGVSGVMLVLSGLDLLRPGWGLDYAGLVLAWWIISGVGYSIRVRSLARRTPDLADVAGSGLFVAILAVGTVVQ